LYERAKMKEGAIAEFFLVKSAEKYSEALKMFSKPSPSRSLLFKNWADTLSELSLKKKSHEDVNKLFLEASEKYEAALQCSDDRATVFNNWGTSCYDHAKMVQDQDEIQKFLEMATQKYIDGLAVKPKDDTILFNWGDVLVEQAKMAETEDEMDKLFEVAREKYSQSSIDPITLNNWGFAYYEHAVLKSGEAKIKLLDEAELKYKEALLLESKYYTSIANIGNVIRERAKASNPNEAQGLFEKAIQRYRESLAIQPTHVKALVYWSQALIEYSQICGENAEAQLTEAKEKCRLALKVKPNYHLAAFTLAEVHGYLGDELSMKEWFEICRDWTGFTKDCYRYQRLSVRSSFSKFANLESVQ